MVNRRSSRRNARQYPRTGAAEQAAAARSSPRSSSEIDDERLELVTITAVDVDSDLHRAIVYFDSLQGADGDAEVLEALERAPAPHPQDRRPRGPRQAGARARVPPGPRGAGRQPDRGHAGRDRPDPRRRPRPRPGRSPGGCVDPGRLRPDHARRSRGTADRPELPGHLPADEQLRDGLAVVDKEAGWTSPRRGGQGAGHPAQPQDRPLGHARPRRHRRAAARGRPGHPAADAT